MLSPPNTFSRAAERYAQACHGHSSAQKVMRDATRDLYETETVLRQQRQVNPGDGARMLALRSRAATLRTRLVRAKSDEKRATSTIADLGKAADGYRTRMTEYLVDVPW